jgi:hypothetical protein
MVYDHRDGLGEKPRRSAMASTKKTARLGRQDKSADRGRTHVVGKIEEFTNVTNTRCWRFRQIMQAFQCTARQPLILLP